MQQIVDWCINHWGVTAFGIACVIQITPIFKCNPLTALFKWIGKLINSDVMKELNSVKETLDSQQKSIDDNEVDRIRFEVLDFANSCRNGRRHTKDEFEHIIVINKKYHSILDKRKDENGVFDAEYDFVFEIYQKCQRENDFL